MSALPAAKGACVQHGYSAHCPMCFAEAARLANPSLRVLLAKETPRMFKPLGDRILVQRIDSPNVTPGGIHIPDNAREKPCEGRVIAVGPGKRLDSGERSAMETRPGDRIMFGKYSGNEIKIEGAEYVILREDDVLGIAGAQ